MKFIHNLPPFHLLTGEGIHNFIQRNMTKDTEDIINDFSGNVIDILNLVRRENIRKCTLIKKMISISGN